MENKNKTIVLFKNTVDDVNCNSGVSTFICEISNLDTNTVCIVSAWARFKSGLAFKFDAPIQDQNGNVIDWEYREITRGDYYPVLSVGGLTCGSSGVKIVCTHSVKVDAHLSVVGIKTFNYIIFSSI